MPAIDQLLSSKFPGFVHSEPVDPIHATPHVPTMSPGTRNPLLRCPTPPLAPISVDNLQQYEMNGLVPQYRILIGGN